MITLLSMSGVSSDPYSIKAGNSAIHITFHDYYTNGIWLELYTTNMWDDFEYLYPIIVTDGSHAPSEIILDSKGNLHGIFYAYEDNDYFKPYQVYSFKSNIIIDPEISVSTGRKSSDISTFKILQNYPNPFNAITTFEYSISLESNVTLSIYDINGRFYKTLVDEQKETGTYSVSWDAKNASSGIYIYCFRAGNYVETKKCVLMK